MINVKTQGKDADRVRVDEMAAFVHAELDCLDQRRFEDWIALFAEDGFYWAPVAADQASPLDHVPGSAFTYRPYGFEFSRL